MKEKTYIVYKHTNKINGKCYIGVTYNSIKERAKRGGTGYKQAGQWKFWGAIKKYGWSNFTHEILEENVPFSMVEEREQFWIKYYDSFRNGYNATLGGKGALGHVPSEEAKKLMGAKNIGTAHHTQKHSEESKKKMSVARKGKRNNPKTEFKKGGHPGVEFKKGMTPWNKGRTDLPPSWNKGKTGALSPCSKTVLQFDIKGNFINEWGSVAEAARQLGFNSSDISKVCRGEYHKTHGFIFKYKNNIDKK